MTWTRKNILGSHLKDGLKAFRHRPTDGRLFYDQTYMTTDANVDVDVFILIFTGN